MQPLRRLIISNRLVACAIVALALALKLVLPAGYMPAVSDGRVVVRMCSAAGPVTMMASIPGREHGTPDGGGHAGKTDDPCAFAGLSMATLGAADAVLLSGAISYVLARGTRLLALPAPQEPLHLRPPLRGPPIP